MVPTVAPVTVNDAGVVVDIETDAGLNESPVPEGVTTTAAAPESVIVSTGLVTPVPSAGEEDIEMLFAAWTGTVLVVGVEKW